MLTTNGREGTAERRKSVSEVLGLALLAGLSGSASAAPQADVLATVAGTVLDLSKTASGELLYCTREGDVGRIGTNGSVTVLATAATGPFADELRGVVEDPAGLDVTVVDDEGELWRLVNGATPAVHAYDDRFLVREATDLLVDASGNYVIPFDTPSNGVRALAWVDASGQRWSYYLREHTPLQLAWDPLAGMLIMADEAGNGALRAIDTTSPYLPTSPLDTVTQPGFTEAKNDGDLAFESDGDLLFVAGGDVYHRNASSGIVAVIGSGYMQLTGIAIGTSSGNVPSTTGFSTYVAETLGTTTQIRELGSIDAPASTQAPSLGSVPDRGSLLDFFGSIQVFELALDRNGDFLIGGQLFGSQPQIRRIDRDTLANTLIADDTDGIAGRVEGIAVAPDGTIYASTSGGIVHAIRENPLVVSTVYTDPQNLITAAQDLILGRNGKVYVADRDFFGGGDVIEIDLATGTGVNLGSLLEARAIAANPFTGRAYVTEWVNQGFNGRVRTLDLESKQFGTLPGFDGMNYTNDSAWGDGDLAVDVFGSIYTISEDDWSLVRWDPDAQAFARIGSSYLNHPSGLVIAPSTLPSTTGWSLFISEFDFLHELTGVHAAAPTRVDPDAPGVGSAVGYLDPSLGEARALLADPAGGGFLIATSGATLVRMELSDGSWSVLADAADGLAGDLVGLAATQAGSVLAAASDGVVFELDPSSGWDVTTLFDDVEEVRGLAVDGADRPLLVDRPSGLEAGRLWRVEGGGTLTLLARPRRGLDPAVDPLTGEVWITEEGNSADGFGEILRVDPFLSPPSHGHWSAGGYQRFVFGQEDGALAFLDDGDALVSEGTTGRIWQVDRTTGARTLAAGGYQRPVTVVVAPGSAGNAGSQGSSLFVLDEYVLWESGVEGLPAGPPPATNPGLDAPADLLVHGELVLGGLLPVSASHAATPNTLYVIFPSMAGKVPGLPLALLGDPTDPRVVPSNQDVFWSYATMPSLMPGFVSFLDGGGATPPGTGVAVPNDLTILLIADYLDFVWVVVDFTAQNKVAFLGGSAQVYVGD